MDISPWNLRLFIWFFMLIAKHHGFTLSQYEITKIARRTANIALKSSYDPFESDPILLGRINNQMKDIKTMSAVSIKEELNKYGTTSKHIFERTELEKLLAKVRVSFQLRNDQDQELKVSAREKKAERIILEIEEIEKLSIQQIKYILKEENAYNSATMDSMSKADLASKLALVRLRMSRPVSDPGTPINVSESIDTISSIATGVFDSIQSTGKSMMTPLDNVASFGSGLIHTEAEKRAKTMIGNDTALGSMSARGRESSLPSEVVGNFSEALKCQSFDEVVLWARSKPRSLLATMLLSKGVEFSRYDPHSSLSALLADTVMIEKNMDGIDRITGTDRVTTGFGNVGQSQRYYPSSDGSVQRRDLSQFSENNPELSIFRDIQLAWNKCLLSMTRWLKRDSVDAVRNVTEFSSTLLHSTTAKGVVQLADLLLCGANMLLQQVAAWSGGRAMRPAHVLFVTAGGCILFRRGLLSFLGGLVGIRLIRMAVRPIPQNVGNSSDFTGTNSFRDREDD
eukprot:gene6520-13180_t